MSGRDDLINAMGRYDESGLDPIEFDNLLRDAAAMIVTLERDANKNAADATACETSLDLAYARLADAETKVNELTEALTRCVEYIEADELAHGRTFGAGVQARQVLGIVSSHGLQEAAE